MAEERQAKIGRKFATLCVRNSVVDAFANRLKEVLLSKGQEARGTQALK